MNKLLLTLIIYNSLFTIVSAQVNVDSLWGIWNDQTQSDTNRLKAIDNLTFNHYIRSINDLDSADYCAQQTIDLAKEKGLKKYEAIGLHNMASVEMSRGNLDQCLELNNQSLAIRAEIGDIKGVGRSYANIALIYRLKGDYNPALKYYQDALTQFEIVGDKALKAHALTGISITYSKLGQTQKAIEFMSLSLTELEGSGNIYFEINAISSLANLYYEAEDITKAKEYAELSIEKSNKIEYLGGKLQGLLLKGNILSKEGKYEEALSICEEVLSITKNIELAQYNAYAYTLMGWTYQEKGDYDNALKYYKEGIKAGESQNFGSMKLTNAIELGMVYKLKKDGKNAVKWCEEALSLAEQASDIKMQKEACKCLYESHKLLKNGTKALEYHERFLVLNDSLQLKEAGKMLQDLEFQRKMFQDSIEQAETDRLVLEAHQEEVRKKDRTRNIGFGIGGLVLLLAGGLYSRLRYVRRSKATLQAEKDRSDNLLLNILPEEIAQELKEKGKADARDFEMVSILFTDFVGFTQASVKMSAQDLVTEINTCFEAFDHILEKYKIEKIKTIGDAYMAAGGLPVPSDDSVQNSVLAALEMQEFIINRKSQMDAQNKPAFEMRVGIHTGPVVAGIVGVKKFQYDIWGDTVNTAARMESSGEVGKVNISQATYELLKNASTPLRQAPLRKAQDGPLSKGPEFTFESRGKIKAKGKGEMEMWFVKKM